MGTLAFAETIIEIPMNEQINLGRPPTGDSPFADAIYVPAWNTEDWITFEDNEFCRLHLGNNDYYEGPHIDFYLAGYDEFDISGFRTTLDFDCRYYQDWESNADPYSDAPIFVGFYTYDIANDIYEGYREYGMVYQTGPSWQCDPIEHYPTWYHVSVRLDDLEYDANCDGNPDVTERDNFDPTRVSRMRIWGTDWWGGMLGPMNDWVDFKNVVLMVDYPPQCAGDLDDDGDTDHSDLGILLADWDCPGTATPVYDTFGFEAYNLGDLPGQDGWEDDTSDPNYGMVQVVDDPTDSNMGKVIMLDPPGTAGGWLGALRALDLPTTARYVLIEWDQWRPDTGDNLWYADTLDFDGWWAMQWDQNGQASSYYFEFGVPITTEQWQHVTYIIDTVDGTATVDIDGEKHTSDQPDTAIDGILFEMEPTEHEGDNGPVYVDNVTISESDDYSIECVGDLDGDNDTDHSDLGILLADWDCTWP
jgi:hypothetical protein